MFAPSDLLSPADGGLVAPAFGSVSPVNPTGRSWQALGPFGATDGQVENINPTSPQAPNPVSGAIHVVLPHPTNSNILYIGSINGGVWRTNNAGSTDPTWTNLTDVPDADPLVDELKSRSISSMAFGTNANGTLNANIIYAGTGRQSSFGQIGQERVGLLKSTNGGQSWEIVDGGGTLVGKNISGIWAKGDTIVVSVNTSDGFSDPDYAGNTGIFRSTDGGVTFTQVSGGNGLPEGLSYDLASVSRRPVAAAPAKTALFTGIVNSVSDVGIFISEDEGATWRKFVDADGESPIDSAFTGNTSNLELSAGRFFEEGEEEDEEDIDYWYVYVGVINGGAVSAFYRIRDGLIDNEADMPMPETLFDEMELPSTNENGTDVGLHPGGGKGPGPGSPLENVAGGQGNIHFSVLADPSDPNIVYVGGDRQPNPFPNSIGATNFTGRLFRGDPTIDPNDPEGPGTQWQPLTHSGTSNNSSPHADSRDMAFDANGNIIQGDDGGVYKRTQPKTNAGSWVGLIGNLASTEIHDVAYDAIAGTVIAGTQDNGNTQQAFAGADTWFVVSQGDGGDVAIDDRSLAATGRSIYYASAQNLGGFTRRTYDASGVLVSQATPPLTVLLNGPALVPSFRTPIELNQVDPSRLVIQGANGVYESLNRGDTLVRLNVLSTDPMDDGGVASIQQNSIIYGGMLDGVPNVNSLWVGSGGGVFFREVGLFPLERTQDPTTDGTIRDLAINTNDYRQAFVIDSDQISFTATAGEESTTGAGDAWQDITGSLATLLADPDSGISELYSLSFMATSTVNSILVGTDYGVFASAMSTVAGAIQFSDWVPFGVGMPSVPVYDMEYDAVADVLVTGTLGRGSYLLSEAGTELQNIFGFGNGLLTGVKFEDLDADGVQSADEPGLAGWTIYLDGDQNGQLDTQQFVGTGTPAAIPDLSTQTFTVTVSGVTDIGDLNLLLNLTHGDARDLKVTLTSPGAMPVSVILLDDLESGGSLNNLSISDSAGASVFTSPELRSGGYRPVESFTAFEGVDPNGDWTLTIEDQAAGATGQLLDWSLSFGETFTHTDSDGGYALSVPQGQYQVREAPREGWQQTLPGFGGEVVIALFDDPNYVDTGGTAADESDNVQASLAGFGYQVKTFSGTSGEEWFAAMRATDVIVIPELEVSDLAFDISLEAVVALRDFVFNGGGLIVNGWAETNAADFLNLVFGLGVLERNDIPGPYSKSTLADGAGYATNAATLATQNGTGTLLKGSLPTASQELTPGGVVIPSAESIYEVVSEGVAYTAVALFNSAPLLPPRGPQASPIYGKGSIAYLGWDWFDASPAGLLDGGWKDVLDSSVQEVARRGAGGSGWAVTVGQLEVRDLLDFGNRQIPGGVSGVVFDDADNSGGQNNGEPGRSGVTVYIDQDLNGQFAPVSNTYAGTGVALADFSTTTSSIVVAGLNSVVDVNVSITIQHSNVADLSAFLVSPTGTRVELFRNIGGSGDNLTGTVFDDSAATPAASGAAPFAGAFKPHSPLSTFNGEDPNGAWTLEITDRAVGVVGTLAGWSLSLKTSELSAITGADGSFSIEGLNPGDYRVAAVAPNGFVVASPAVGYYDRVVAPDAVETGLAFGLRSAPPTSFIVGDYNRDGGVDAADYTVWRDTLGSTVPLGQGADGVPDGVINQLDYDAWKAHFGQTSPALAAPALASLADGEAAFGAEASEAPAAEAMQPQSSAFAALASGIVEPVSARPSPRPSVVSTAAQDHILEGLLELLAQSRIERQAGRTSVDELRGSARSERGEVHRSLDDAVELWAAELRGVGLGRAGQVDAELWRV